MKKLFESRKVLAPWAVLPAADAKREYLGTIMVFKKIIRMGTQKAPLQKPYEINVWQDSIDIDFLGANRQFDWLETSLVYDKSDKHTSIYESYNHELAAKWIKTLKLSIFTEIYSLTNEKNMTSTIEDDEFGHTHWVTIHIFSAKMDLL